MVNIEFLVVAYFIGMFVDWVFQAQWQADNKSNWGKKDNKIISLHAVISHSLIYAWCTSSFTGILINKVFVNSTDIFGYFIPVFLVLFITHAIIDTRILVKLIMRLKGLTEEQINDYKTYGFMHIGIDHRLHEMALLILAIFLN